MGNMNKGDGMTKTNVDFFSMYELTRIDLPRPSRKYCKKMLCDEDGEYLPVIDGDTGEVLR